MSNAPITASSRRLSPSIGVKTKNTIARAGIFIVAELWTSAIAPSRPARLWKADETGNVVFRKTARNFNMPAATCGKVCVAEVEEIVPVGELDPDAIHLPGVFVNRLIVGAPYDKKIEFVTTRDREAA